MAGRKDERDGREDRGLDGGEVVQTERIEATALERITRGEVDMQVATAKKFPRSIAKFRADALSMATVDEETAAACFYVLKRDGKSIEGPGVRLAEIVAGCWGNMRAETRIVEEGDRFVTAQATCWDLERNLLVRVETQRRITTRDGRRYGDDMIVTTSNAAAAIALRNAVFKVVPGAYVKSIYEEARRVAVGDARTLSDRRARAIEWFAKLGVDQARVLAALGKKSVEDVDLTDLETMQGMRTAIQDGSASVDETFPPEVPKDGTQAFGRKAKEKAKPKPADEPKHDPKTGEVKPETKPAAVEDEMPAGF